MPYIYNYLYRVRLVNDALREKHFGGKLKIEIMIET